MASPLAPSGPKSPYNRLIYRNHVSVHALCHPESLLFAAPATLAAALAAALFGLLIGSFLNVVMYRLPVMAQRELDNYIAHEAGKELPHQDRFDLMVPRSACPHCGHRITALENIPIVSWLVLRGKCSACKAPISPRYPIVEAAHRAAVGPCSSGISAAAGWAWRASCSRTS